MATEDKATETPAVAGAPVPVVVQATPLATGEPTPEGKERAEFMQLHDQVRGFNDAASREAARVADSGLGYYDDNPANRRYITRLADDALHSPFGSPVVSLQRKPFPVGAALAGTLVVREDGSQFAIPPGVRRLVDVIDPDTGESLVGDIDKKAHKARLEAAGIADQVKLKADGTVEPKS
jgi:hypothetical protein